MSAPEEPQPRLLDLISRFISRTDELLGYLAQMEKSREKRDQAMLQTLQAISTQIGVPPTVIVPGAPPTAVLAPTVPAQVIPKPEGAVRDFGSVTTTDTYQTVAKIKPQSGKKFKLAKQIVSCSEDVMAKLVWAGQDLGPEVYVMAKLPYIDWFPYGFRTKDDKDLEGDGTQEIMLQVKYPSGGTTATAYGELSGDEE